MAESLGASTTIAIGNRRTAQQVKNAFSFVMTIDIYPKDLPALPPAIF
jgi:hypothetical protein